jgi:hypothetical protein
MLMAAGVLLSASLMARADTIYTYTGNDFTSATGPYTTSDFVSGSFTLASPLGDDLSNYTVTPLSFSFSDGVQTLTNSSTDLTLINFVVTTNSSGAVTEWSIDLSTQGGGGIYTHNNPGVLVNDEGELSDGSFGYTTNSPGTFTVAETPAVAPEPASLLLLGTGLLGFAVFWRRRLVV